MISASGFHAVRPKKPGFEPGFLGETGLFKLPARHPADRNASGRRGLGGQCLFNVAAVPPFLLQGRTDLLPKKR